MADSDSVIVTDSPLGVDEAHRFLEASGDSDGATVVFCGRVRRFTDPRNTGYWNPAPGPTCSTSGQLDSSPSGNWLGKVISPSAARPNAPARIETPELFYECYPDMALKTMQALLVESREKWPLGRLVLWHRVGRLVAGELAIVIGVTSSHRGDAYEANQFLIEQVKRRVPVWKKEVMPDGQTRWVHPGLRPRS